MVTWLYPIGDGMAVIHRTFWFVACHSDDRIKLSTSYWMNRPDGEGHRRNN
ncbi:hypothetical protein ABE021_14140 [Sporosarcina gallistercoris]|uniref:hypothetical protein n=1 Tax=Sporosarcina gallistercoris TaxID=2762245 RepID=UPI003D2BF201